MTNEASVELKQSPFFDVLSDAESIQVREVAPSTQGAIIANLTDAIKGFEQDSSGLETRSFLITVKKPVKLSTPQTPAQTQNSELQSVLIKAEILLKNEDYLLARNLFSYVLRKDIKNCQALRGLGDCLLNLGDTTAAKKCFTALAEVHSWIEGYALLGICLIKENNDKAALDAFTKVKDPSKLSAENKFKFYKELGNCLTRLERFTEASENYHHALSLNPRSHTVLINLGTLEIQRKRYDKATQYFQQAIDFYPAAAKAYCGIGLVADINGEREVAEIYFNKTLDTDCLNSVALHQLYALAETDKDWRNLRLRLVQALIKDPSHLDNRFLLAATLLKQNDWVGCEGELNVILLKHPNHPKARILRDELSLHRHRQGGAV